MFRLYSERAAGCAIERESVFICGVAAEYGIPTSWIQAILLKEMTEIDLFDLAADLAVKAHYLWYRMTGRESQSRVLGKRDSSTGWSQIFGFVAINALNRAVDRSITDYKALGIHANRRLQSENPDDLWLIWRRLNRDRHFNIELCALNLLACAEEMTGRTDVSTFSEEETKRTFTRYNANVRSITKYGVTVYDYTRRYWNQQL